VGSTVLHALTTHSPFRGEAPHLAASLLYLHTPAFGSFNAANCVTWTLEIEVQFYLLAPVLAALFKIRHRALRRAIVIAAIFAFSMIAARLSGSVWACSLPAYLSYFLVGFLLADIYLIDWNEKPSQSFVWDTISAFMSIGLIVALESKTSFPILLQTLLFLAFVGGFRGRIFPLVLRNPWISATGGMCYSIYLLHYPFISGLGRFTRVLTLPGSFHLNLALQAILVIAPLMLVSGTFYLLVERPCMQPGWLAALWGRFGSRPLSTNLSE
jgi:peptidoglycan/LPS O-acetylase OafA/YrhL